MKIVDYALLYTRAKDACVLKLILDNGVCGFAQLPEICREEQQTALLGQALDSLLGKDVCACDDFHGENMIAHGKQYDPAALAMHSCLSNALWDAAARCADLPLYQLFGGSVQSKVDLCPAGWDAGLEQPEEYAARAAQLVEEGYRLLCMAPVKKLTARTTDERKLQLQSAVDCIQQVMQAVKKRAQVIVDLQNKLDYDQAIWLASRIDAPELLCLLHPFDSEDAVALSRLEEKTGVSVCVTPGAGSSALMACLQNRRADYLLFDAASAGGMWYARRLSALCEPYYVHQIFQAAEGIASLCVNAQAAACLPKPACILCDIRALKQQQLLADPLQIEDGALCLASLGAGSGFAPNLQMFSEDDAQ